MIINSNVQAVAGAYAVSQGRSVRRADALGQADRRDEIVLSREAQSFSSMLQELKGMDETRQDKVDFYSRAIASGNYSVPSADIASRMLLARF